MCKRLMKFTDSCSQEEWRKARSLWSRLNIKTRTMQVNGRLDELRVAEYMSTTDLKCGYWQVLLTTENRPQTASTVWDRDLHSAPSTFQWLLDYVVSPDATPHAFVYLDDIAIVTPTFENHIEVFQEQFLRRRKAQQIIMELRKDFFRDSNWYQYQASTCFNPSRKEKTSKYWTKLMAATR